MEEVSFPKIISAHSQKRTHAVQQKDALFDHLVGAGEQGRWHVKGQRHYDALSGWAGTEK